MLSFIPKVFAQTDFNFQETIKASNPGGVFVGDTSLEGKADFLVIVGKIAETSLAILAILCIGVLILAGYKYVTAMGNEEQTQKAKTSIQWAIIGLLIAIFSYSIVNVIVSLPVLNPS